MDTTKHPENACPKENANPLSAMVFAWTTGVFKKGVQRDLSLDDLYKPLPEHESSYLGDKLQKMWNQELRRAKISNAKPSLLKVIVKTFGMQYFAYSIILFLDFCVGRVMQCVLLGRLLDYFREEPEMNKTDAYITASAIIFCSAFSAFAFNSAGLVHQHIGMKMRVACCSLIYRKVLSLSKASLSQTSGQVVNLLSNDVTRFDQASVYLFMLWIGPMQSIIVIYFVWMQVGYSALACTITLLLLIVLQGSLAKIISKLRLKVSCSTDKRVQIMDEIISGIRIIKMYTWEKMFTKIVKFVRRLEIKRLRATSYIRSINYSFILVAVQTEICTTVVMYVLLGNTINAQKLFVITSLINTLRMSMASFFPQAITLFAELLVAMRRLQDFLLYEENTPSIADNFPYKNGNSEQLTLGVTITNASGKWNSSSENTLSQINIEFIPGKLVAVIGPVGSGKTSLLHAILGELPLTKGFVEVNGRVSYAAQEPWLFSASVQQNILFGSPFDLERYKRVVEVCALNKDFQHFPYVDQTIVGERGISLSGGQKARVNLARAVYRDADIYLFDDPLSAVDTFVGKQLFENCITSFLRNKTCILVTHQLQYLKNADHIVILCNGSIEAQGNYSNLLESGMDFAHLLAHSEEKGEHTSNEIIECSTSVKPNSVQLSSSQLLCILYNMMITKILSHVKQWLVHAGFQHINSKGDNHEEKTSGVAEHQAKGSVDTGVYKDYIKAGGNLFHIFLLIFLFIFAQVCRSGSDYWTLYWANQEELQSKCRDTGQIYLTSFTTTTCNATNGSVATLSSEFSMYIYVVLVVMTIVTTLMRSVYFFHICIRASQALHKRMFDCLMRACMRFFDTNPSGRILNRFSKDMGAVDDYLPQVLMDTIQICLGTIGSLIVISVANYWLSILAIVFGILFYFLRVIYVPPSRSIKRLEGISRSPVFTHLNASIQGLTTIRAFGAQQMLSKEFDSHQNLHSSAWYLFISTGRAFGFWLDCACVIYLTFVILCFLIIDEDYLGGNVGLAITQSITLMGILQWGIRQSAEVENNMTSAERILEYSKIDQEPPFETDPGNKPSSIWPQNGEITFNNVYLRYSNNDPPVLKGLSFKINPKEKIGIVGRTGAGKSSLIIALFRLAEVDGSIFIDNVDTKSLGLHDLRSKISIIPQDPVLFSGTLRKNLDPFDEYPDDILWRALEDVHLKDIASNVSAGLLSVVEEGGSNFSVGQRQLLCLARAIVRSNKILVLDEATANVDQQTDALIQMTIRSKFPDCTVLTVAHRLHTIMDSDRILVMDAGRVVEYDHPYNLLQNEKGCFHNLVQQTGWTVAVQLRKAAEQSYKEKEEKTRLETRM